MPKIIDKIKSKITVATKSPSSENYSHDSITGKPSPSKQSNNGQHVR